MSRCVHNLELTAIRVLRAHALPKSHTYIRNHGWNSRKYQRNAFACPGFLQVA
jgi:hypothetical protein